MEHEVFGYRPKRACEIIPCGKTKLYELIAAGRLDARKLGSGTIITRASIVRLHEELPDAGLTKPPKGEPTADAAA